jgi:hypothetical protein
MHGDHVDEHVLSVNAANPAHCATGTKYSHTHGPNPNCRHQAIPHGDYVDYLVAGRLHHPHGDHCERDHPAALSSSELIVPMRSRLAPGPEQGEKTRRACQRCQPNTESSGRLTRRREGKLEIRRLCHVGIPD